MNRALANAMLPLTLLVGGAAFESLRPPIALLLLLIGLLAFVRAARRRPSEPLGRVLLVYAGCFAVALNLAWGGVPLTPFVGTLASCGDRLAPFAILRAVGAVLVLTGVGLVLWLVRAAPTDIGLRWPSRHWLVAALVVLPTIGAAAVLIGPLLAEPFFGPMSPPTADPRGFAFALVFALANASMEELVYRGALLRWLIPVAGVASAVAVQAFVFGLAHGVGADFVGSPLPVMAATAAAGLVFGALALRTRSLLVPIAIHVALDIPVYFGKVCLGT